MMDDIKKFAIITVIFFSSGIISGWFYGSHIIKTLMRGDIGISTYIFTPAKNLIDTYIMLNSGNELQRLEGYYCYRETGQRDYDFLYTRYKLEESVIIKKTIIWIAETDTSYEKIDFYKKLYDISYGSLKKYLQVKIESFELINNNTKKGHGEK